MTKRSWEKRTIIWDLGKLFGALNFSKKSVMRSFDDTFWPYPFPVMPIIIHEDSSSPFGWIHHGRQDASRRSSWCGFLRNSLGAFSLELQTLFQDHQGRDPPIVQTYMGTSNSPFKRKGQIMFHFAPFLVFHCGGVITSGHWLPGFAGVLGPPLADSHFL